MKRMVVLGTLLVQLGGCGGPAKKLTAGQAGVRPNELDLLDVWVGEWEDTGEVRTPDSNRVGTLTGVSSASWKCDKRFLVEEMNYDLGEGARESAVAVRTWDPHAKLFRSWYFDNHGIIGHSKMTYDAATKTWRARTRSHDPVTCEPIAGDLVIKMFDARTSEWTYTEWDRLRLKKRVEMRGMSRRK